MKPAYMGFNLKRCIDVQIYISITHCTQNTIYVFPEIKLYSLVPNSCSHVPVSNLYIPRIGQPILLQLNKQTNPGNI